MSPTYSPLPLIQSLPHGGLSVPAEVVGRLAISETTLYNECDLWVDQLFDFTHPDLAPLHAQTGYAGSLAVTTLDHRPGPGRRQPLPR